MRKLAIYCRNILKLESERSIPIKTFIDFVLLLLILAMITGIFALAYSPQLTSGVVISKEYDDPDTALIYTGHGFVPYRFSERFLVTVSGTTGDAKLTETWSVSEETYNNCEIGDTIEREKKDKKTAKETHNEQ